MIDILEKEIECIIKNSPIPTDPIHSKKTREWVLKLKPYASEELQIAALAHDIERGFRGKKVEFETYDDYKEEKTKFKINYMYKRCSEKVKKIIKNMRFSDKEIEKLVGEQIK